MLKTPEGLQIAEQVNPSALCIRCMSHARRNLWLQSAMKLLARGKGAAPPAPGFWAPHGERSHSEAGGLVYRMEPLPDDLEPEE